MKTIRLLLLGSFFLTHLSFLAFSQQLEKHKTYIFQTENGPDTYSSIDEVKSISEVGDSILMEIEHDNELRKRVKDSLWSYENKIYMHDVLLYDYNLQVGDSFTSHDYLYPMKVLTYVVKSIDTVIGYNGEKIKRWHLKHEYDWLTWHMNYGEKSQGWFYRPQINALIGTYKVLAICKRDTLVYWRDSIFPRAATPSCDFNYLDTYLGIDENANRNMEIGFFPNPSNGVLFFKNEMIGLEYQIIDLNGKVKSSGSISVGIDIQHLTPGIYLLQIQHEEKYIHERLIVR
jgi:hypothetical protein